MSLTPKDGPDGRGESRGGAAAGGDDGGSLRLRAAVTFDGLRALAGRVRAALGRRLGRDDPPKPDRETAHEPTDSTAIEPVPLGRAPSPSSNPDRPPDRPDEPHLIVEHGDGTLTIRRPDDPESRVESDTWVPVER